MGMLAVIWHFWIGFFLAIGAFGLTVALIVGYLVKVKHPEYPRKP